MPNLINNAVKEKNQNLKEEKVTDSDQCLLNKMLSFPKLFWISLTLSILEILHWIHVFQFRHIFVQYGISQNLKELFIVIPGFLFSFLLYNRISNFLTPVLRKTLITPNTRENETQEARIKRIVTYISGFTFYSLSFCTSFYATYKEGILPKVYGGNFDFAKNLESWPDRSRSFLKIIHLISYGHHLERLVNLFWSELESQAFYVMFLHHIMTVGLIAFAYHFENFSVAVIILMMNDQADIILNIGRVFREFAMKKTSAVCYFLLITSWIQTRILGLPIELILPLTRMFKPENTFIKPLQKVYIFPISKMFCLFFLNIFWFSQMIRYFIVTVIKKNKKFDYLDSKKKAN